MFSLPSVWERDVRELPHFQLPTSFITILLPSENRVNWSLSFTFLKGMDMWRGIRFVFDRSLVSCV